MLVSLSSASSHLMCENVKITKYETIILPAVPYGCECWSVTLAGEQRLFKNMAMRISGPNRDEGLPLWSSGQGSWLQIRRPGFDSLHY
jgi:hypothetical protein